MKIRQSFKTATIQLLAWVSFNSVASSARAQNTPTIPPPAQTQVYPRIAEYAGILHPLLTFDKDGTHANFGEVYAVGMPLGINIWKSAKIGFSLEVVPFVRAENGSSRMNNLLIHPGILASLGNGFTLVGRVAFKTSGRYGLTPVLNKVVKRNKNSNYFVAVPLPLRFGNDRSPSIAAAFQFGIGF